MSAWTPIVGKSFTPDEFQNYVAGLKFDKWKPQFCVRHNTAIPTLASHPHGLTHDDILALERYYRDELHWHAGPHLFVDDRQIWVFSPLTAPGVHSPSWNAISWGVEQLGDYAVEEYESGRGLQVQNNAIKAIAILNHYGKLDSSSLRDHLEDKATDHICPGHKCHSGKSRFILAVHAEMIRRFAPKPPVAPVTKPTIAPVPVVKPASPVVPVPPKC